MLASITLAPVLVTLYTAAKYIIAVAVGAWITQRVSGRPRLVTYYGHVSQFLVKPEDGAPEFLVNTHSIVIENTGRKATGNIRISHNQLPPNVSLSPARPYAIETLQGGIKEIVLDRLSAKEQITISYLYLHPLTFNQVTTGVRSDDGQAKVVNMRLSQQYGKKFNIIVGAIFLLGCVALLYLVTATILNLLARAGMTGAV